ncbi:T9SS type A sorting domain-containing protein [Hymenobacter sp. M29]|uniref:T9SS type A sorting domain-containing protein n=1 Tax=Hymenobacter mellowenesis TaxID=3063995 RepID=A0ABT9AIA5_9BACT|nr:T9SS type A sorting domain-containing protein [Hymenobacter sp. M29]MDO7849107.1 T9SS type A sorting domain-containing protein [Hymenobacter sp. M29]
MTFTLPQCGRSGLLLLFLWLATAWQAQAQTPDWQAAVAAAGDVQVQASTTDGSGNVYLAGGFAGTATFGSITLSTTNTQELFVAKWNPGSGFAWALKGTGSATTGRNAATAIAVYSPYVYVAGNFVSQTLTLGARPALTNAQAGNSDIFLARLNESAGGTPAVNWAKRAGGTANDYATSLTNLVNSYLYLGGSSGGNASFDAYTLAGTGGFVALYSATSATLSTTPAPVVLAGDAVTALSLSGSSLYAAGTFNSTANTVPGGTLTSAGGEDLFVLKLSYANVGSISWAQRAGGSGDDYARSVLARGTSVYVGGSYRSASASFGSTTLANPGVANLFVSKLTDAGTSASFTWALQNSGTSTDASNSVNALALYGTSLYAAGTFGGTASLGTRTLTSAGGSDVLVAKITDRGSSATFVGAQQAGGTGADNAVGVGRLDTRTWYVAGQVAAPATFGSLSVSASAGVRPGFVATLSDPAPLLTLAAPNAGPLGTTITLYGEGLAGTSTITFAGTTNNVVAGGFIVNTAGTQISGVVVPSGAQSGPIEVATPLGNSNALVSFTVGTNTAPTWQSAAGSTGTSSIRWAAPAAAGTVVVAGEFSGTITLGGTTLTSVGGRDLFVAKFNPSTASYVWAVRAGGAGDEDTYAGLAVSGNSVYVAGQFNGQTIALGSTTLTASSPGSITGYVAKLTDAGSSAGFTWAQLIDDGSGTFVEALTASGNNVYVGGDFTGAALQIGGVTALSSNASQDDGYVAKLVDNGSTASFGWAQGIGNATGPAFANSINVYGLRVSGSTVYLSGVFYGTVSFGATTLSSINNDGDVAVARLTDSGTSSSFTGAVQAGSAGPEFVVSMSQQGNALYVSGSTNSTVWQGVSTTGTGIGFVLKVLDNGAAGLSLGWVQLLPGVVYQTAPNGTGVYVATSFGGTVTLGGTLLQAAGAADGLVLRLADGGSSVSIAWAQAAGGLYTDDFQGLALVGGRVVVGGRATPLAAFGSNVLTGPIGVTSAAIGVLADPALLSVAPSLLREPLALYPNPAHGRTTLRLPVAGTGPVQLFDAMGREVRRYAAPAGTLEAPLDLRGLPAGVYIVRAGLSSRQLLVE